MVVTWFPLLDFLEDWPSSPPATDGAPDELFDEASGRWFVLPHSMAAEPRKEACVVSLPAAVTTPAADPGAAGVQ